jgi:hypothetical protein
MEQKIIKLFKNFSFYKIPYVIVGGMALVLHGIPRATLDIDIVIPAEKKILYKIIRLAKEINLNCPQEEILLLSENVLIGQWLTFKDEMERELVDVFLEEKNKFDKLYRNSLLLKGKKINLRVASLSDLEKMKKKSGRKIDLADIALIQELKKIKKRI